MAKRGKPSFLRTCALPVGLCCHPPSPHTRVSPWGPEQQWGPSRWAAGLADRGPAVFALPSPAPAVSVTPAPCLSRALPSRRMGWSEAGREWQAGGPPLLGSRLFCMTQEGRPVRRSRALWARYCPSQAWPRPRGACDLAGPGLACLSCQDSSGSWTGSKEQKRSPEPLCGALASECGGEGWRQWDFCVPGAGTWGPGQEYPARAICPPSFLELLLLSGPRPSSPGGELAWTQPIPALPCPLPLLR